MKLLIAMVEPLKLEAVREALTEAGAKGLTISEVQGHGRQRGHTEIYRGAEYSYDFVPKIRIESVVPDDVAPGAIEAVIAAAQTGSIGDGKIFALDVASAVRIRTGETDEHAL